MGITVTSSSSIPAATSATNATNASSNGAASDSTTGFAALFSGQLDSALAQSSTTASLSASTQTGAQDDKEDLPEGIPSDPALALFLSIPPVTPPVQPNTGIKLDATLSNSQDAAASDISMLSALEKGQSAIDGKYSGMLDLGPAKTNGLPSTTAPTTGAATTTDSFAQALDDTSRYFGLASNSTESKGKSGIVADETANLAGNALLGQAAANTSHLASTAASQLADKAEVSTPLHNANWNHDFSEKIVWLAKNDQQSAQININPPQLGPVQVTLHINGDQASAIFSSPHAEVRQAIESSLPQLKEMLSAAGINLGQSDVGANLARQNQNTPFQAPNGNRSTDENAILPASGSLPEGTVSQPIQRGRGLVDLFA